MRKFLLQTLLFLLPVVLLAVFALLFMVEAGSQGDLARMSATRFNCQYPDPQTSLPRAACTDIELGMPLPRSYSHNAILVLGDSFSHPDDSIWPHDSRWHQYLGGAIGRPVVSMSDMMYNPFQLFLSILKHRPTDLPDTVFIETVERAYANRITDLKFDSTPHPDIYQKHQLPEPNLYQSILGHYKAKLDIANPVLALKMDTTLFSCHGNTLYALKADTSRQNWIDTTRMRKNLQRLVNLADEKGITLYVVLIPDKFSVYHHRCVDDQMAQAYRLVEDRTIIGASDRLINPLAALRKLVDQGKQDVYLPDDSHFSALAAKQVGLFVASAVSKRTLGATN